MIPYDLSTMADAEIREALAGRVVLVRTWASPDDGALYVVLEVPATGYAYRGSLQKSDDNDGDVERSRDTITVRRVECLSGSDGSRWVALETLGGSVRIKIA